MFEVSEKAKEKGGTKIQEKRVANKRHTFSLLSSLNSRETMLLM